MIQNLKDACAVRSFYMAKQGHKNILRQHLESHKLSKCAVDLLCNLLVLDPAKRLTAIEAFGVSTDTWLAPLQLCV